MRLTCVGEERGWGGLLDFCDYTCLVFNIHGTHCPMDTREREKSQLHLEPCGSQRLGIIVGSF